MKAELFLTKNAKKDFSRLPLKERKKIVKKLDDLETNSRLGKPLQGKFKGFWSLRAWPYRIIYEITKIEKITVLQIVHRQKAYR